MTNENETVEQVCREISCQHEGMIGIEFGCFANRIFAANKREVASIMGDMEKLMKNSDLLCVQKVKMEREIEKRNALIKELADALDHAASNRCIEDCKNKGCKYALCVVGDWRSLVAKAREVLGGNAEKQDKEVK